MPQRSVATNYTFEQQRTEINLLAADFWSHYNAVESAKTTYLKHDGSNNFTGGTLNVPAAFTINSNSGAGTLTISGDLNVTGTTTTVNTTNLDVTDKNITIAKGNNADATADGAGITIDSATDITWNFVDAKDAWVSSIGVEGTTFVKGPYGQFTGSGTPTTGQGVEVNAPDANTGQIISYDRGNSAYKQLNLKGSSVQLYTGTTNAIVGTFNSTGLTMESGKNINTENSIINAGGITIAANSDIRMPTGSWTGDYGAKIQHHDNYLFLQGGSNGVNLRNAAGNRQLNMSNDGHFGPANGQTYNLGSAALPWTNFFIDGNIAINESSPDNKLHITTTSNVAYDTNTSNTQNQTNALLKLENLDGGDGGGVNNYVGIQFAVANGATSHAQLNYVRTADNSGRFAFKARNGGGSDYPNLMDITSAGQVLIGASSSTSSAKLAVNGCTNGAEAFFELNRTDDPNADQNIGVIEFSQGNSASRNAARIMTRRDGGVWGAASLPTRFEFHTCISGSNSATEKLRIASNGNVLPGSDNAQHLGSSSLRWAEGHINWVKLGTNGSWLKENNVRFQSGGEAYIDHATVGQGITFRTSNSSSLDTSAMFVRPDGRLQVYCLNNSSGLELNVGSNAGSLVFDRNGHITSFIRASDKGSNVAGASGGGSRVNLNKEYIQWFTFPPTTNVGDAPTYTERMRLWNGGLAVGKRVGDPNNSAWSNQPVAFQSDRVDPDGADANVHTAQRCNLYVGSNTGWAQGDGGAIGLGGSGTGTSNEERLWGYIKGSRQSANGWEYAGYLDLGTQSWNTNATSKKQRIWGDGQVEWYPTDNTMMSWKIGGAQRMKFTHTGGGNIEIDNSNGTMTFDTGSDYRLKKDESAITNALTTVKALKPYQFTYRHDNRLGQGFFAHEAQAVLPDVGIVSGTKDAVHTEDDTNEGYKKDDPIYQQIDYSKLVPLLTAALQEATAKIETLETKVAALESA